MAPLSGLYVHVPFCQSKCPYCDFYSLTSAELLPAYLEALRREVLFYKDSCSRFDSLYLGGGTPSLLDGAPLGALVQILRRHCHFAADTEFTLEANPEDVTPEKLRLWRDLGVNRLSLGAQSLDDQQLRFLKRRHTAAQTRRALARARAAGFANLGLDLIYGLPGQSPEAWRRDLEEALHFAPEHLSCYLLTAAPGTPLSRQAARRAFVLADEETQRTLFLSTCEFLEGRGYLQYEVSNFARGEEHLCRHNRKYWQRLPYLGLGPAAHSFRDGRRWWNHRDLKRYCRDLEAGRAPIAGREILTPEQIRLETLYLGFRTREGVPLEVIRGHRRGPELLAKLEEEGLAVRLDGSRLQATPRGLVVADRLPLLFCD